MESNANSDFGKAMAGEEEERSTLLGALGKPEGPNVENAGVSGSNSGSGDGAVDIAVDIPTTAHEISQDSWLQVGFVLTTGVNSAYVLGYPGTIMVPLGWIGGVIGLLFATVISLYANALVAKIHELGGRRHIRYRDLAGFIYGRQAYNLTWALQYVNLFMINVGFIILAGNSLKAIYVLFRDDHFMKLPHFIGIAGLVCSVFAISIPHLSALGIWLAFSMVFNLVYFVIAFGLALKDGTPLYFLVIFPNLSLLTRTAYFLACPVFYIKISFMYDANVLSNSPKMAFTYMGRQGLEASPRDYSIPGTLTDRIFTTIGGLANLFFAFNTGMLPEIQATVREPVIGNMMKALYFQFTVGVLPLYAVAFIGYWAYGSKASSYLLNNVSGPIWLKATANLSALLQTIIALHIFASPMYEYLDTRFGVKGSPLALRNLCFRITVRGGYMAITTFMSALLPFLGDFMSLTGALSTIPLTFVLANHMYLIAMKPNLTSLQATWHWLSIILFGFIAVAATAASLRLIVADSNSFHIFADL